MNTALFSKLGWPCQPNFEKREISGGGGLPKAAALPRADMLLPFQGVGPSGRKANKRIEQMTSSAVTLSLGSLASGALLVMAHPPRSVSS